MHTVIVGGGLCGLAIADALETQGRDYTLLEARSRFGGRIKTEQFGGGSFDLGPAWFWPGQPRLAAMIERFGLTKFDQFSDGDLIFEDQSGQIQRHHAMRSPTSWRLRNGLVSLTDALADRIPKQRKHLEATVCSIAKVDERIVVTLTNGHTFQTDRVILALPPRIASKITFSPRLPEQTLRAMEQIPTWMAGQAKAVAVYDTAFWQAQGLSGNAISHRGPLMEVHDASPETGPPYALFGFIGLPPAGRKNEHHLRLDIKNQLERLFGPHTASPKRIIFKDWTFDPHTAVERDKSPQFVHPQYGLPSAMKNIWDQKLHFSGTEVANDFGGYLEGALEAAESVLADMGYI